MQNSKSEYNASTANQGVECINGVWMMKCNKGCGWNTTHTTKYCNELKRNGASFSVPPLHLYWALSKKAHPSASATGSTIPSAGSSDGHHSTMSDRMISLINRQMTQTKNSDMVSLLAELKNCLQGN